jgi:predicted nucleic acid-binding Zn ribbon protein
MAMRHPVVAQDSCRYCGGAIPAERNSRYCSDACRKRYAFEPLRVLHASVRDCRSGAERLGEWRHNVARAEYDEQPSLTPVEPQMTRCERHATVVFATSLGSTPDGRVLYECDMCGTRMYHEPAGRP